MEIVQHSQYKRTLNSNDLPLNQIDERWLSMSEAASYTPYSAEYLSLLARKGKLGAKKIDNVWYTTKSILDGYMKRQMMRSQIQNGNFLNQAPQAMQPEFVKTVSNVAAPEIVEPVLRVLPKEILIPLVEVKDEINPVGIGVLKPETLAIDLKPLKSIRSYADDQKAHAGRLEKLAPTSLSVLDKTIKTIRSYHDDHKDHEYNVERIAPAKSTLPTLPAFTPAHTEEIARVVGKALGNRATVSAPAKIKNKVKSHFKTATSTKLLIGATVACIVLFTIVPVPVLFSPLSKSIEAMKSSWGDARTVMGFRPGTGPNELLLLDKNGNISIMGHIQTDGQLQSFIKDGVAPIVVDSKTEVKNLNAEYLNGASSTQFTLAFVTKNGAVTTEDVTLGGNVNVGKNIVVGQTLLVNGTTKLLASLQVDGNIHVLGDAEFAQIMKVVGPAYFEDLVAIQGDLSTKGNFAVSKNADIRGSVVVGSAILAKSGSFGTAGVSGKFSVGGDTKLNNFKGESGTTTNFFSDKISALIANVTSFIASDITVGGLTAGNSSTTNAVMLNATTTNSTTTQAFVSSLIVGNATTTNSYTSQLSADTGTITNLFATNASVNFGTFANILATASSTLQNFTFNNATGTNSTTTNAQISLLTAGNATSTNLFSVSGNFTNLGATNFNTTNSNISNLVFTNATGTSATTTNMFSSSLIASQATTTNLFSTNSVLTNITGTNLNFSNILFANATGTSATTTNFFSTTGAFNSLYVNNYQQNNGTFNITSTVPTGDIFSVLDNAITNGTLIHQTITANAGNGQTSKGQVLDLVDSTVAGGSYIGLAINVSGSGIGSGSKYLLDLNPGVNKEAVFDATGAFRPTTAANTNTNSVGTPSFYWKNGYFDTLTANNLSGTVVTGATSNHTWTIGSTELADVNEALIFQRNSGSGNATLQWNASSGTLNDQRYLSVNYPFNANYTVTDASIGTGANLYSGLLTNNTTSGTQKLLSLTNTGTGTTENGIYLNNTGTGVTAFEIAGTWTNGIVTNNNSINAGTGALTSGAITSSGALALGSNTIASGLINGQTISSAANFTGSLTVAGVTTLSNLSASLGVYTDGSKNLTSIVPTSGQLGYWTRSGTNLYNTNQGDNVGIGTTNPTFLLTLKSPLVATDGLGWGFGTNAASRNWLIRPDQTAYGDLAFITSSSKTAGQIDTVRMTINPSGNVGIGTTGPGKKLEILDSSAETTYGLLLTNQSAYASNAPKSGIMFGRTVSTPFATITGGEQENNNWAKGVLQFGTRTSDALGVETKMTILNNGNVGIGTTNPNFKLEVNGTASTTGLFATTATIGTLTLTNDLTVANGGTGVSTFTTNGVLYGNAATSILATAAGTSAQFLVANVSGVPTFVSMSSDATLANTGALTLATVATGATTGSSTAIPIITFNNKGLVTGVTTAAVIAPAGTLSGTTLNSGVTASSLTSVGTLTSLTLGGALSMGANTITSGLINGQTISNAANFTGTLTSSGQTILAGAFRFYNGGSDGSTAYGDFRTNTATGNSIISAKTNALYFNYDHGTGGVIFSNGAQATVATVDGSGNANFYGTGNNSFAGNVGIGTTPIYKLDVSGVTNINAGGLGRTGLGGVMITGSLDHLDPLLKVSEANATSCTGCLRYGGKFSVTGVAAGSTNIALYATAANSGTNWAGYFDGNVYVSSTLTATSFSGPLTGTVTGHSTLDLALTGGTMSGTLAMGANAITSTGTITSGLINGQTISSAANFTGSVAVGTSLTVTGEQYFNGTEIQGDGRTIIRYSDTYLRLNEDVDFTNGIWMGGSNFMGSSGIFAMGSNGGTTNSRVYINSGAYNGTNVINLDGATGNIYAAGTVSGSQFNGSGAGLTILPVSILTSPNASYGGQLTIGGNGGGSGVAAIAKVQATDGNLHLDPGLGKATYINYYSGTGVNFGNGASGVVATISSAGLISGSSFTGAGTGLTGTAASLTAGHASVADDVYAWAKASVKPSYGFTEISGTVTDAQVPNNITIDYAGVAGSANLVNGTYTSGGGLQPPSYIPNGQVRFNMMAGVPGTSGYQDWLMMDTYTGGDVPYVTMIGVSKTAGAPVGYLAVGAKGGATWTSTPIITGSNISSQTVATATNFSGSLAGDVTGTQGATVVGDNSHNHDGTTISGLAVADFTSPNLSLWTNNLGWITSAGAPVQSVAGRTGAVTLAQADISGLTTTSNVQFRDITATRDGGTTGVIYFGANAGSKYLFFDGTNYNMPGGALYVNSSVVWTAATLTNLNQLTNGPGYITSSATSLSLTGNLTVSSGNTTGGGIILADDGDIVDLNDAYASMRFSSGVRIYSANRGGTPVITLGSNGQVTASQFNGSGAGLTGTAASLTVATAGNLTGHAAGYAYADGGTATALSSGNYISQAGSQGSWNADFQNTPAGTSKYGGDVGANTTNGPGGSWWIQENYRHTNGTSYWGTQVAWGWEDNANRLATRNVTAGTYGGWVYYLNSANFNTYAPTLTGTGASGSWGISVTGSAGSVPWSGITSLPAFAANAVSGRVRMYEVGCAGSFASSCDAGGNGYVDYADAAGTMPWSGLTGVPSTVYASAARPGPTRLYRSDDNSDYSLQTNWNTPWAGYWGLRGYSGGTFHAEVAVGYAAVAGDVYAWAKAASKPSYGFSEISGTVTDAQVPDNITISYAGSAGSISNFTVLTNRTDGNDYSLAGRGTGIYAITGAGTNGPGPTYLDLIHATNGGDVAFQIAGGYVSDNMYFRGTSALQSGTSYTAWRTVLHNGNFNSYAPTLTGGGASGNWAINSNGLYGSPNITTGTITSGLINGQTISSAANFTGTLTTASTINLNAAGGMYQINGSNRVGDSGGNYTLLYRGSTNVAGITLGGSDPTTYYDNTTHIFRGAGFATSLTLNATTAAFGGTLTTTGSVGIGTTDLSLGKLTVYGGSATTKSIINASGSNIANLWARNDNYSIGFGMGTASIGYIYRDFNSPTATMAFDPSGNVGIGTESLVTGRKLSVIGGLIYSDTGILLPNRTANAPTCGSGTEGTIVYSNTFSSSNGGSIYLCRKATTYGTYAWGTVSMWNVQNPDIAEYVPVQDESIQGGELISISNVPNPNGSAPYDRFFAERTTAQTTGRVLGIVSTNPGQILNTPAGGPSDPVNTTGLKPLALAGRVPVKVTTENGLIQAGDYVTVSKTVPGRGMKAAEAGDVVGQALNDYDESTGEVLVLVGNVYRDFTEGLSLASTTASLAELSQSMQDQSLKIESMQADITTLMNSASTTMAMLEAASQRIMALENYVASSTVFTSAGSTTLTTGSSGQAATSSPTFMASVLDSLTQTFASATTYFKDMVVEAFTVGKADKPTGITFYDSVNGEPFCLKVTNGQQVTTAGICVAGSIATSTPVVITNTTASFTPIVVDSTASSTPIITTDITTASTTATTTDPTLSTTIIVDTTASSTATVTP